MGEFLKQYDKECLKMAMMRHEETFRHQVNELHRLYRVQKILMEDMQAELKKRQISSTGSMNVWTSEDETASPHPYNSYPHKRRPCRTLDFQLPAEEYILKDDGDGILGIEEGELELSLGTGCRRNKKDGTSLTSDSGASFSSSSADSNVVRLNGKRWGSVQLNSFEGERKLDLGVEEQMRQSRMNQPPWLLQCFEF
ncbi:hypothetical protein HPP92_023300 [Vanilla planifolia]|uniref:Uncharacterized protein n=1 Tax=Vanilla planifolia TaxID=51239 RepID=A0A835PZ72_VANPL|nr:hypothetical protein HPP92_023691 [Vanilla planifolia]KAG0460172.1 hypothetical protein HPP92_023300 [Vanilla planifolia]